MTSLIAFRWSANGGVLKSTTSWRQAGNDNRDTQSKWGWRQLLRDTNCVNGGPTQITNSGNSFSIIFFWYLDKTESKGIIYSCILVKRRAPLRSIVINSLFTLHVYLVAISTFRLSKLQWLSRCVFYFFPMRADEPWATPGITTWNGGDKHQKFGEQTNWNSLIWGALDSQGLIAPIFITRGRGGGRGRRGWRRGHNNY